MIRAQCEVLTTRRVGSYHSLTLVAPEIADEARPGQFVEIGVPPGRSNLLRRPFSIHQASRRGGWAGTLELVYDVHGPGTEWMTSLRPHDVVDAIGPLGQARSRSPAPSSPTACSSAAATERPRCTSWPRSSEARGKRVDMVIGARNQERVFKAVEGKRLAVAISITTEDGSSGARGRVTDVLPAMVGATTPRSCTRAGRTRCSARWPSTAATRESRARSRSRS